MKAWVTAFALTALLARAHADTSPAAESFDFLLLDTSARCVALGGSCTVTAQGAAGATYNPAGLALQKTHEAAFMHNDYAGGIAQEHLALALQQGFGLQLNYLNFGSLERTTLSRPDGTGQRFGASDTALAAAYGRRFGVFAAGAGIKYLRESIEDTTAGGYAIDLGMLYAVPEIVGLRLGASLLNVGPEARFRGAQEKLPTQLRLGAAYAFSALGHRHTAVVDLTKVRTDKMRAGLGLETVIARALSLRGGFTNRQDAGIGLAAGVGWDAGRWSLDYAFTPLGPLGDAHRVSVALRWGGETPTGGSRADEAAAHLRRADELLREKQFEAARAELDAARALMAPGDARRVRYLERLGTLALRQGDTASAKARYIEALKLGAEMRVAGPALADAYAGMGLAFVAERRPGQAVGYLEKALALGPSPALKIAAQLQLKALQNP